MSRDHHTCLDISTRKSDSPLHKSLVFEDFRPTKRVPLCKWLSTNYNRGLRASKARVFPLPPVASGSLPPVQSARSPFVIGQPWPHPPRHFSPPQGKMDSSGQSAVG
ncbi:hypothetical protein JTE90_015344 [Oedothorax gibbosus]|uniref:Uncharacterized protein n=1 Tax=Oedothorax gibbosus TaxID=931172 RepID=A0AAV6TK58_9ARAC|nr:hypothetical protein JTE90_015344 [Oedothorax gibbosus]